jgi:hypothetical protein
LVQANDRLGLLSRCNADTKRETLRGDEDRETGCQWVTWTRIDSAPEDFRFHAFVQRIVMHGSIRTDGPSEADVSVAHLAGGLASTAQDRYYFEHKKDLANHVWAVALHDPERAIKVNDQGKPISLPWSLESVHEASGNAMARGKRLWRDKLASRQGRFDRLDSHYGFARYLLVPHAMNEGQTGSSGSPQRIGNNTKQLERTPQIRVERFKVMPEGELVAMFAPAQGILFDKPFQPLCPGREKDLEATAKVEAELVDLFSAAGEDLDDITEQDITDAEHLKALTPPAPTRRRGLLSLDQHQQSAFHERLQDEYDDTAAVLGEPGMEMDYLGSNGKKKNKEKKSEERNGFTNRLANVGRTIQNSLVGEVVPSPLFNSYETLDNEDQGLGLQRRGLIVIPLNAGHMALAAQQGLWMAIESRRQGEWAALETRLD